jgi:hypothetical protein
MADIDSVERAKLSRICKVFLYSRSLLDIKLEFAYAESRKGKYESDRIFADLLSNITIISSP